MCGIFLTMDDQVDQKFMDNMFVMDALRGKDSCGLVTVTLGEVEVYKDAVPALQFIKAKPYDKIFWKNTTAAIGHNRAATAGVVNARNAHPFTAGKITGVHNGTLLGQWRLPDSQDYAVDSENIIHSINKIGIDETWPLIDGAAALIWFNVDEQTINVIRNDERELYMTLGPTGEVYIASEKFMMLAAMERNHLPWTNVDIVPTDTLFTIDVHTRVVTTRVIESGEFPYTYNYTDYYRGQAANTNTSSNGIVPFKGKGKITGGMVNFMVDYVEHGSHCTYYYVSDTDEIDNNLFYTIEDYQNKLNLQVGARGSSTIISFFKGETFLSVGAATEDVKDVPDADAYCNWCSSAIHSGERYTIDAEGALYCPVCSGNPEVKDMIGDQVEELIA